MGLGDIQKVLPEVMAMSAATQENLAAIRKLLEELVEIQKLQLKVQRLQVFASAHTERLNVGELRLLRAAADPK